MIQKLIWKLLTLSDLSELKSFLTKWEYRNVNLSRYFFNDRGIFNIPKPYSLYICRPDGDIACALLKGPYGLFLPIFSYNYDFMDLGLPIAPDCFSVLLGTKKAIRSSELNFSERIKQTVNYHLFATPENNAPPEVPPPLRGLTYRKAEYKDLKSLFPLQQAYEIEEVILDPATFNPLVCFENLKRQLKNDIIIIAEENDTPVAKVGTNARGLYYGQLGGVFTRPEYRGRGISTALTAHLLFELKKRGLKACLFAKPENKPALKVYQKCGFEYKEDFRITYLRH